MTVRGLRSQEALHEDSGAIVRTAGREADQVDYLGHTLTLNVERSVGHDVYYLPASLTWDDGTPIPANVVEQIKSIISEVDLFWGSTAEFQQIVR